MIIVMLKNKSEYVEKRRVVIMDMIKNKSERREAIKLK